jgi:hypothetical protein
MKNPSESFLGSSAADPKAFEAYVEQAASLIALDLSLACRPGVLRSFQQMAELVCLVLEFSLPDYAESAPTFRP